MLCTFSLLNSDSINPKALDGVFFPLLPPPLPLHSHLSSCFSFFFSPHPSDIFVISVLPLNSFLFAGLWPVCVCVTVTNRSLLLGAAANPFRSSSPPLV